jgi:tetratricopeptide (TPR) repeat protein
MLPLLTALILLLPQQPAAVPVEVDPALRTAVGRFFETQQAEDADAYLALWSDRAPSRPTREQLAFIFESGDDTFIDLAFTRAVIIGETARVRVAVTRVRTDRRAKNPDGTDRLFSTRLQLALSFIRDAGEWKLLREGAPADELAQALIQTDDADARRRLRDAEPDLLNARLVDAIARQADALAQRGAFKGAQSIYERGLEVAQATGDRRAEGQAIQNIANSLYFQRDFPRALEQYERRLAIERELANQEGIANALLGIATVRYSNHEYGHALASYREALAIQETLDDDLLMSTTLISTGNVLYLQGDYDGAIADYRRAEQLKRKYLDLGGAATALEGLGRVYTAQGDYAAALGAFAGVLDERRTRGDIARQAFVLQSIGEIHFRLGNTDQARAVFEESRGHFESAKDAGSAGRVLQGAALNELVVGRFAVGEKAYARSIALCTPAGDQECVARAQVGLAFALAAQQKFDDAITWYSRSILSFAALKMTDAEARARIGLADAHLGKGTPALALEEAVSARRTGVALESDDVLWRALVAQARAERKLGRPSEAMGAARAALLAIDRMSAAALDRPGQAISQDAGAAFSTMAVLQAESGDAAGALVTSERMRALQLRAWLAPHEREIARGMTEAERDEERSLATELSTLIVRRDRQQDLPNPDAAQLQTLDTAIAEVVARRRAFSARLFERLPDLRIWRGLGRTVTIDDVAGLVREPGRLMLQFLVDERDLVVITARTSTAGVLLPEAHVVSIDRQVVAERIAAALDGKALADAGAWRTASAELFQLLPAPVRRDVEAASSVLIVPDDVLWRVPFEAMPVRDRFLADRAGIEYATSVAALVLPPPPPAARDKAPVLVLHSPALGTDTIDALKTTAPTWALRSPEAASAEVDRILASAPVDSVDVVRAGAAATREALRQGAPTCQDPECGQGVAGPPAASAALPYEAVHLAAPFRVNSGSPLFSPLLLAPVPAPAHTNKDGAVTPAGQPHLTARDIFALEPLAPVVMFSDPVALSRRDAAARLAPIAWAWRSIGATTLIVRRWAGDDAAASAIIGRFYEGVRSGACGVRALQDARARVRGAEGRSAPAAWAGWVALGGC